MKHCVSTWNKLAVVALALTGFAISSQALAQVITDMGGTNAVGIENLDIDGTLYNVAFIESTAMDLYRWPPHIGDDSFVGRQEAGLRSSVST